MTIGATLWRGELHGTELLRARLCWSCGRSRAARWRRTDRSRPCSAIRRRRATVGWALNALRGSEIDDVPWQRVINSHGRISISRADLGADLQRALLEEEGVEFDGRGYVDLKRFGWRGLDDVERLWQHNAAADA